MFFNGFSTISSTPEVFGFMTLVCTLPFIFFCIYLYDICIDRHVVLLYVGFNRNVILIYILQSTFSTQYYDMVAFDSFFLLPDLTSFPITDMEYLVTWV